MRSDELARSVFSSRVVGWDCSPLGTVVIVACGAWVVNRSHPGHGRHAVQCDPWPGRLAAGTSTCATSPVWSNPSPSGLRL